MTLQLLLIVVLLSFGTATQSNIQCYVDNSIATRDARPRDNIDRNEYMIHNCRVGDVCMGYGVLVDGVPVLKTYGCFNNFHDAGGKCLSNSTCQLRKIDKIGSSDGLFCCCTTSLCNHPFKSVYVSQNATWCRQSKKSCVWSENSIMIAAAGCSLLPLLTLSVVVIGVLYAYRRLRLRRRWKMITDNEEVTSSGVGASDGASPLIDCDWRAAIRAKTCCIGRRLGSYRILLTEKNMWTGGGWSVACSR